MYNWFLRQWRDISGNVKFWLLGVIGVAIVTATIALTHGLYLWQQVILSLIFLILFAWAVVATVAATRPKEVPPPPPPLNVTTTENIQTTRSGNGLMRLIMNTPSRHGSRGILVIVSICRAARCFTSLDQRRETGSTFY